MMCSLASLSPEKLETIRALEHRLGKPLLAFACHDMAPAKLDDDDLDMIRRLESDLGLSLVAVSG